MLQTPKWKFWIILWVVILRMCLISRKGNLPRKLKALALQISFHQFLIIHAVGFEEWVSWAFKPSRATHMCMYTYYSTWVKHEFAVCLSFFRPNIYLDQSFQLRLICRSRTIDLQSSNRPHVLSIVLFLEYTGNIAPCCRSHSSKCMTFPAVENENETNTVQGSKVSLLLGPCRSFVFIKLTSIAGNFDNYWPNYLIKFDKASLQCSGGVGT